MKCAHCKTYRSKRAMTVVHHAQACALQAWRPIVEARQQGEQDKADRLTRRLLGVVEPMTEEAKAKLKAYAEEHKDEIREKAKAKRQLRQRMLALTKVDRKHDNRRRTP